MKLKNFKFELGNSPSKPMENPYTNGLFSSVGHYGYGINEKPFIYLTDDRNHLKDKISYKNNDKSLLNLSDNISKYTVPLDYDTESKLKWLAGYLDGNGKVIDYCDDCDYSNIPYIFLNYDGTTRIIKNKQTHLRGYKGIGILSYELKFFKDIVLMLQTLGINSKISIGKNIMRDLQPYHLTIDSENIKKLIDLGFQTHHIDLSEVKNAECYTNNFICIKSVGTQYNELEDIYIFKDPLHTTAIFNGILAG